MIEKDDIVNKIESPVMTVAQTAEYLQMPVSTIYELVRHCEFPALKIGKSWRVVRKDLDEWMQKQLHDKPYLY